MPNQPMQGEDAIEQLDAMFEGWMLDEYKPAWEAMKADWERVCRENREMRKQLKGAEKDGQAA